MKISLHRWKVFGFFCLIFIGGFIAFSTFNIRLGPRGNIAMQGAQRSLLRVIAACYTGDDSARTKFMVCAQRRLEQEVKRWGVHPFMQALSARQQTQQSAQQITQCHDLSHAIGAAGVIAADDLNSVIPACTNTCVYGCQHGAVSAWYAMGKDIVSDLATLCVAGIDWSQDAQGRGGCFHEVGHALASVAGYDITKALRYCDQVAEVGRADCGYGVFMELFEPSTFLSEPLPLPANHPQWCETLWSPYKEFCYAQAGVNVYGRSLDDAQAFRTCRSVPEAFQKDCFHNLGMNIFYVYQYKTDQVGEILRFCQRSGMDQYMSCIAGSLLSSIMSQEDAHGARELCMRVERTNQASCFSMLGTLVTGRRTTSQKSAFCSQIPEQFRSTCQEANE